MHNCRRTQNSLNDLIFDELPADQIPRILAEIETCNECKYQYTSLTETLALFDEAASAALPKNEGYWLHYDERLRSQLNDSSALQSQTTEKAQHRSASFWRRALYMRVQIPVPVLAAAVLVIAASLGSLLLLRSPAAAQQGDDSTANMRARSVKAPAGSNDSFLEKPAKIIEVPVVQERIVTRVVYVNRRPLPERKNNAARSNNGFALNELEQQRLARATAGLPRAPLTRQSLAGFQPTNEVKLTVIKASEKQK